MKNLTILTAATTFAALFVFTACTQESKQDANTNEVVQSEAYKEGQSLVNLSCITCHTAEGTPDSRIAPPLFAIKEHYLEEGVGEAEFVQAMSEFLLSPKISSSKMPNAVKKFGLKPMLGFSKEQYEAIATYLYQTELEKPDWFEEHHEQEREEMMKNTEAGAEDYLKKGMNIALATKSVLGKNLLTAIQKHGAEGAVEFCNDKAIPLTDSMALQLNASIKRVSDKNRNPNHAANPSELAYIQQAKLEIQEHGKASPKVFEENGKMLGYYPILTNTMCLQCHGVPHTDINGPTLSVLQERYPQDKATGYGENELRGIWVIEMDK